MVRRCLIWGISTAGKKRGASLGAGFMCGMCASCIFPEMYSDSQLLGDMIIDRAFQTEPYYRMHNVNNDLDPTEKSLMQ